MPPANVKRVVSTDFGRLDNPIPPAAAGTQPPFLVTRDGVRTLENIDNFLGEWDVLVLKDENSPHLPTELPKLTGVTEVIWLVHDLTNTKQQRADLDEWLINKGAGKIFERPFHHGTDANTLYLNKVAALLTKDGVSYDQKLEDLDGALRAEQMESDVCDFLWSWAALRAIKFDNQEDNNVFLDKLLDDLDQKKTELSRWLPLNSDAYNVNEAKSTSTDDDYTNLKNILNSCLNQRPSTSTSNVT